MAKTKTTVELCRVNINLPVHIVSRVKEYADNLGINTTSAYIVLLNQALEEKSAMNFLPSLAAAMEIYQNAQNTSINSENEK